MNKTLEIGKSYKNGSGENMKIVCNDDNNSNVFIDSVGRSYYQNGRYFYNLRNEKDDRNLLL